MKTESCVGYSEFRITTINGITGKARLVAQIFPVRSTISAFAIGPAKPRDAHAISNREFRIFLTDFFHMANNLMTWYERQFWIGQLAINHMKIGAADSACCHPHQELSLGRSWFLYVAELERLPRLIQNHRAHGTK